MTAPPKKQKLEGMESAVATAGRGYGDLYVPIQPEQYLGKTTLAPAFADVLLRPCTHVMVTSRDEGPLSLFVLAVTWFLCGGTAALNAARTKALATAMAEHVLKRAVWQPTPVREMDPRLDETELINVPSHRYPGMTWTRNEVTQLLALLKADPQAFAYHVVSARCLWNVSSIVLAILSGSMADKDEKMLHEAEAMKTWELNLKALFARYKSVQAPKGPDKKPAFTQRAIKTKAFTSLGIGKKNSPLAIAGEMSDKRAAYILVLIKDVYAELFLHLTEGGARNAENLGKVLIEGQRTVIQSGVNQRKLVNDTLQLMDDLSDENLLEQEIVINEKIMSLHKGLAWQHLGRLPQTRPAIDALTKYFIENTLSLTLPKSFRQFIVAIMEPIEICMQYLTMEIGREQFNKHFNAATTDPSLSKLDIVQDLTHVSTCGVFGFANVTRFIRACTAETDPRLKAALLAVVPEYLVALRAEINGI